MGDVSFVIADLPDTISMRDLIRRRVRNDPEWTDRAEKREGDYWQQYAFGELGSSAEVLLPFEDDHLLTVILSKTFLLADDTKMTDRTILQQMGVDP